MKQNDKYVVHKTLNGGSTKLNTELNVTNINALARNINWTENRKTFTFTCYTSNLIKTKRERQQAAEGKKIMKQNNNDSCT